MYHLFVIPIFTAKVLALHMPAHFSKDLEFAHNFSHKCINVTRKAYEFKHAF